LPSSPRFPWCNQVNRAALGFWSVRADRLDGTILYSISRITAIELVNIMTFRDSLYCLDYHLKRRLSLMQICIRFQLGYGIKGLRASYPSSRTRQATPLRHRDMRMMVKVPNRSDPCRTPLPATTRSRPNPSTPPHRLPSSTRPRNLSPRTPSLTRLEHRHRHCYRYVHLHPSPRVVCPEPPPAILLIELPPRRKTPS
jgi:hypothetical protein